MRVVLDAWAIVAAAEGEPGAERVRDEIERGEAGISWINLGEAYYVLARRYEEHRAWDAVERASAELLTEEPRSLHVMEAARLKAKYKLSYADAFAVEAALRHRAPLLTADPEILELDRPDLKIIDLSPG